MQQTNLDKDDLIRVFSMHMHAISETNRKHSEIAEKLEEVVGILGIDEILDRRPAELSGGQQQRVALGRCIIRDADVYLMDEPLSHLDSELRLRTRGELKRIQELHKRTVIYVTHDQIEALALADRIAVMADGLIQQIGTPEEVYETPANLFVAGFIGEPPMNLIAGSLCHTGTGAVFNAEGGGASLGLPEHLSVLGSKRDRAGLILGIRPQHIHLGNLPGSPGHQGQVLLYESLGEEGVLEVDVQGCTITALTKPGLSLMPLENVTLSFNMDTAILFDKESGHSLTAK